MLEKNFQDKKKEFTLNESKFSFSAQQESGWFEEKKTKIYRVKREEIKMPEENKKILELQPRGLMLVGLERDIQHLKANVKFIQDQLDELSSKEWLD